MLVLLYAFVFISSVFFKVQVCFNIALVIKSVFDLYIIQIENDMPFYRARGADIPKLMT